MTRPSKPPLVTEKEVQRAILDTLDALGVRAWRNNVGSISAEHKGRKRFVRFGEVGAADILGVLPGTGRLCAVEVKRPGNHPTPAQIRWMVDMNERGGFAFWATSARTVEVVIRAALLNPGVRIVTAADGSQDLTDEETRL